MSIVRRLYCFLLCIIGVYAHSQTITISGTIKDSSSMVVLDSVRVDITQQSNPSKKYTIYTNTSGKWSYTFPSTGIAQESNVPFSFALRQNYPNPFNPSTIISFSVPQNGIVTILVHNILGQMIDSRTFSLTAGEYNLPWSNKGSAGTLFYTMQFDGYSITKKMVQLDGGSGDGLGNVFLINGFAATPQKGSPADESDFIIHVSKLGYEPDSTFVPFANNSSIDFSLTTVHRRAFVFDLHNDVPDLMVGGYQIGVRHTTNQSDIPRFIDGGIDAQMMVLWPSPTAFPTTSYQRTIQMYDTSIAQFNRNSDNIVHARTISEIQSAHSSKKIAAVMCVEGGLAIQDDLNKLIHFYNLGVRYMTITWNVSSTWATSAADAQSTTKGLSEFGKQVIRTMDSLGMIIDVSHTGIKTIEDILATTKNPIIASHSGVRTLRNHTRNLTNDQIIAIAQGGGVIGVVFYTSFLSTASAANVTIDTVIKHIDHIKNLVGIDHIAIGSDYDGGITAPVGLENVSKLQNLTMALLRKGYSSGDVKKILGENYLRVFKAVCK